MLQADRYITVQDAAERCNVSYSRLEQHLIFYHKELVENRIKIRKQALKQQCKGKITGRGTLHAPTPEIVGKYAEALHLYRTTPMSARKTAKQTGYRLKAFTNTCKPGTRIWFAGGKASLTRKASRWTGHPCEDTTLPPPPNTLKPSPG